MKNEIETELGKGKAISIVALVDLLIEHASLMRASDIHIDPRRLDLFVRLRIDGVLSPAFVFPKYIHAEIVSRIKILSGLRTDVHAVSQDGRTRIRLRSGDELDIRISIVPTLYGENVVLRVLAAKKEELSLEDLGLRGADVRIMNEAVKKTSGMILITGPTGSGKTTTLYSLLELLNTSDRCLVTIEDPIEYSISNVRQIQAHPAAGFGFARGLRAMLRQDPNVIMVGEIRDEETAKIAVNTALTGHLLLSTLHTNDAASTLPRLLDMRVDAYLIASTVSVIVAQRLVRRICERCIRERECTPADIVVLSRVLSSEKVETITKLYEGVGCDACCQSGFAGRLGLYEVMKIDNEIKDAIVRLASSRELRTLAMRSGMRSMFEDGIAKALTGLTTIEEVIRVIHE